MGVVAAAASGDSSTSGHFFWLQREQLGPESEARPCTVWRWCRCGQTCGMLGGPGGSLWGTQAGGSLGWGRPRRPREVVKGNRGDRRGDAPQGRVPGRQAEDLWSGARLPAHLGRGRWLVCTSCRLWYSFSSSSSAAAFSVGSCHQNLALGSQGESPAPTLCPLTPPQPGLCVFSSPAHQARKGAAPSATLVRGPGWPEASRQEGQSSALGQGWGQTLLLTFLLCDQAHQDPNRVLIGVLGPVGRVDP